MRRSFVSSLALACGVLLFSTGAHAIPIHVGLTAAAGEHKWTSPGFGDPSFLTLSGWQFDDTTDDWVRADMTDGEDALGKPGLGVCSGALDTNNVCQNTNETNELDSTQMIDMDITALRSNWTGLTVWLLSVDNPFRLGGSTCSQVAPNCGPTAAFYLPTNDCTSGPDVDMVSCAYSRAYLTDLGITDIWVLAPYSCDSELISCSSTNFLLSAGEQYGFVMDGTPASVIPEPSALGMFGLGALLMGLFAGLRRRRRTG